MSSSFVYQPHVRLSDGTVITPDIAIDRAFVAGPAGQTGLPVSWLTSASVLQLPADDPLGAPAVVLVAASFGMLVSVGAVMNNALPVTRQAWRYDDIADKYPVLNLRSWAIHSGERQSLGRVSVSVLPVPESIMAGLGNPLGLKAGTAVFVGSTAELGERVPAERFEVVLEGADDTLRYGIDLEEIG